MCLYKSFFTFQALLSAAIACAAQYYKDDGLSDLSDWDFDRASLFYVVFIVGLVIVFVLFVCFLFNLNKRCGSPKGWTLFVSISALFISVCKSQQNACFIYSTLPLSPVSFTDDIVISVHAHNKIPFLILIISLTIFKVFAKKLKEMGDKKMGD